MKKYLTFIYLVLSISILLTFVCWYIWSDACQQVHNLAREGDSISSMCAGDGTQFIGDFIFFSIIASAYIAITALVFKILGIKLVKK